MKPRHLHLPRRKLYFYLWKHISWFTPQSPIIFLFSPKKHLAFQPRSPWYSHVYRIYFRQQELLFTLISLHLTGGDSGGIYWQIDWLLVQTNQKWDPEVTKLAVSHHRLLISQVTVFLSALPLSGSLTPTTRNNNLLEVILFLGENINLTET